MPVKRAQYPANWAELAQAAREAAGWRCARCGVQDGALQVSRRLRVYRVVLAACHLDHDHANPAPRLAVLGLQHVPVMYAGAIAGLEGADSLALCRSSAYMSL